MVSGLEGVILWGVSPIVICDGHNEVVKTPELCESEFGTRVKYETESHVKYIKLELGGVLLLFKA